jgi:hypothetical protein
MTTEQHPAFPSLPRDLVAPLSWRSAMTFDDTQSMLQFTIGLNLAYFSFREIRTPSVVSREAELTEGNRSIASARELFRTVKRPERLQPGDRETSIFIVADNLLSSLNMDDENLNGYAPSGYNENIQQIDRILRWMAFGMAGLGLVLLYIASVWSDEPILVAWFSIISALSFLPILLAIGYSLIIAKLIDDGHKAITDIRQKVSPMVSQFKDKTLPEYQKIIEAKATGR